MSSRSIAISSILSMPPGNDKFDDQKSLPNPFGDLQAVSNLPPTVTHLLPVFVTVTETHITTTTPPTIPTTVTTTVFLEGPHQLQGPSSVSSSGNFTSPLSSSFLAVSSSLATSISTSISSSNGSSSATPPVTAPTSSKLSPLPGLPSPTANLDLYNATTLSSGAVAGITLGSMLFTIATILLLIMSIRLRLKWKRANDRTGVTPFVQEKQTTRPSLNQRQQKRMEYLAERLARMARMPSLRNRERPGESSRGILANPESTRRYHRLEEGDRPSRRRNHDGDTFARANPPVRPLPTAYPEPSARRLATGTPQVSSLLANGAVARLRFSPSRPDELLVSPGDQLRVVALYDDGWAFCKNTYGGKGMVPTLCLKVNEEGGRMR